MYTTHDTHFTDDVCPARAAAILRSRFSCLPGQLRSSALSDFTSYPAYLFTKLARRFPEVHHPDLDCTVEQLLRCYTMYISP